MNFDHLQSEAERLVVLLKERHPGLATWCQAVRDRLDAIQDLVTVDDRPRGMTLEVAQRQRARCENKGVERVRIFADALYVREGSYVRVGLPAFAVRLFSVEEVDAFLTKRDVELLPGGGRE